MANLRSEEENCPSSLTVEAGDVKDVRTRVESPHEPHTAYDKPQRWQSVGINLTSGRRSIGLLENEDCLICREPTDEMQELVGNLRKLLAKEREQVFFEPSEPSFELSFVRTRGGGIKVEAWIDAGNGSTAIYTWDACGVRFYTTDQHLQRFTQELEKEFQC